MATDASAIGAGIVVYQIKPGEDVNHIHKDNIIGIASKKFNETQQRYSAYKKELWAVIYGLRRYHWLLWAKPFHLITDHFPLIFLKGQPALSQALQQWLDVLLDYDFTVHHRAGVLHVLPDVLSRMYTQANQTTDAWGVHTQNQLHQVIEQHLCKGSDFMTIESLKENKPPKSAIKQVGGGIYKEKTAKKMVIAAPVQLSNLSDSDFDDLFIAAEDSPLFSAGDELEFRDGQHYYPLTYAHAAAALVTDEYTADNSYQCSVTRTQEAAAKRAAQQLVNIHSSTWSHSRGNYHNYYSN